MLKLFFIGIAVLTLSCFGIYKVIKSVSEGSNFDEDWGKDTKNMEHTPKEEEILREADYIIFNLRQSIKHEIEGTNIGQYKDDVHKYKLELTNYILKIRREAIAETVQILENVLADEYEKRNPPLGHNMLNNFAIDILERFKKVITQE